MAGEARSPGCNIKGATEPAAHLKLVKMLSPFSEFCFFLTFKEIIFPSAGLSHYFQVSDDTQDSTKALPAGVPRRICHMV